jgi:3-phytase
VKPTRAAAAVIGCPACALIAACAGGDAPPASAQDLVPVLVEVYETPRDTIDNIDSPAVWHAPDGRTWLLATAKETDIIVVYDAATGEVLRRVGTEGTGPGQFDRPNGIAVIDDLLWVVERDNARVQILTLPDFHPLGSYGARELRKPYGIAIMAGDGGTYFTFITDNYEVVEDVVPADSLLGERVRLYRVEIADGAVMSALAGTFGDTQGAGVLRVVESIAADAENDLLLIAEEQEGASMIKAYTRDGSFTGRVIEQQFFPNQAEGMVLHACPGGAGYWIATDQGTDVNTFHVFDRTSLAHLGSFRGRTVRNTDGIALTQRPFPGFAAGAFFAVHNDGSVAAFRWEDIANALGLRADCAAGSASF